MKSKLIALVILAMALVVSSCSKKSPLEQTVAQVQKQLPINNGNLRVTDISLDDNCLSCVVEVDDKIVDIDALNANKERAKSSVVSIIMLMKSSKNLQNDEFTLLMKALVDEKCDFQYIYKSPESGKECTIFVSKGEIQEAMNSASNSADVSKEYLDNLLASVREQVPVDCGGGLIFADVECDDDMVFFVYGLDENITKISDINREIVEENKEATLDNMRKTDAMSAQMLDVIKEAGMGFGFKYVGDISKETFFVIYTNEEL